MSLCWNCRHRYDGTCSKEDDTETCEEFEEAR